MSTFFRVITESVPSLFRGIFRIGVHNMPFHVYMLSKPERTVSWIFSFRLFSLSSPVPHSSINTILIFWFAKIFFYMLSTGSLCWVPSRCLPSSCCLGTPWLLDTVTYQTESIFCIYRVPGFPPVVWFGTPPLPSRQHVVSLSQTSCVSPVELTDGMGGGGGRKEPNHMTARKPGPL